MEVRCDCLEEPTDIIPSDLTHIIYAFADVNPSSGSIFLTNLYADEQVGLFLGLVFLSPSSFKKLFPGDYWEVKGNNLYGCLKQVCPLHLVILSGLGSCLILPKMYLLKMTHR